MAVSTTSASGHSAIEFGGFDFDAVDCWLRNAFRVLRGDLAAGVGDFFALVHDGMGRLGAHQVGGLRRDLLRPVHETLPSSRLNGSTV